MNTNQRYQQENNLTTTSKACRRRLHYIAGLREDGATEIEREAKGNLLAEFKESFQV